MIAKWQSRQVTLWLQGNVDAGRKYRRLYRNRALERMQRKDKKCVVNERKL